MSDRRMTWAEERDAAAEACATKACTTYILGELVSEGPVIDPDMFEAFKAGADWGREYGKREALTSAVVQAVVNALAKNMLEWEKVTPHGYKGLVAWQVAREALIAHDAAYGLVVIGSDGEGE